MKFQLRGFIYPSVEIKIGCSSLKESFNTQTFTSLVDEYYPDRDFTLPKIQISTVKSDLTFLEKTFLLHEEFQCPANKIRIDRLY